MAEPNFQFYHDDSTVTGGTAVDSGHPVAFGRVQKGMVSPTVTIHVWNGKNNPSVGLAVAPRLYATNGPDDGSPIFAGTPFNGFLSMLEARSCGSFATPSDQDSLWTPISPTSLLMMGDMPGNSMREIELRANIPIDAPNEPLLHFSLQVSV